MADILHRVGVTAPLDDVYRAVATPEGVAGWWTTDTTDKDGQLLVRFGEVGGFDIDVLEADPEGLVRWRIADGPAEWLGTEISFRLDRRGEYTIVRFQHEGWREPGEFMAHCSTKWATFLMSLKQLAETGHGRPAPDDVPISDWH